MGETKSTGPRVLIADDDANICRIMSHILESAGYQAVSAGNGDEAVEVAKRDAPDIILMDYQMPIRNGYEACRTLKKDPATRKIPVLICSSQNRTEDIREAIRAGADDFIVKPFNKESVLRKVMQHVRLKKDGDTDRRFNRRRMSRWFVSWGMREEAIDPLFKGQVLDISRTGFAFEFDRCGECTGYEEGTVHPKCLFAPMAQRFAPKAEIVEFLLSVNDDVILEVKGRVVHVLQKTDSPAVERVGVHFIELSPAAAEVVGKYVDGTLDL